MQQNTKSILVGLGAAITLSSFIALIPMWIHGDGAQEQTKRPPASLPHLNDAPTHTCLGHLSPIMLAEDDPYFLPELQAVRSMNRLCKPLPVRTNKTPIVEGGGLEHRQILIDLPEGVSVYESEGLSLACAAGNLLHVEHIGQHYHAYDMLNEVAEGLTLHGGDGYDLYPSVFCGDQMKVITTHVLYDAFLRPDPEDGHKKFVQMTRRQARKVIDILDLPEALPFIEKRFAKSESQLERIELSRLWLVLRLLQMNPDMPQGKSIEETNDRIEKQPAKRKADIPRLMQELKEKLGPDAFLPVIDRALKYYEEHLSKCGGFCYESGSPDKQYFNDPSRVCPPDEIIQEVKESCPLRPPS